ncbi:MAG: pilus assembly protein, partial [Ardenticatenaceae bacterium]|nr:pilus assembly protein [Ardenticatenaceae bacterium]
MAHKKNLQGQALLEFALIITVLLMMMFLIIESARILWAWNTVQNAAREGARYAITGQFNDPCNSTDLPKFAALCDGTDTETMRVASIVNVAHEGLSGLPLNETSGIFEDDNYYQIEVWGVNDQGQIQADFGGLPNTPVVVRAFYRVPIITPLLQPIVPSVPVFGQVTMNNESFGQLGNANQGQGVPPELPPIPTAGVTPSPTFTPTNTPSPTPGPTSTDTLTPTYTPSVTPSYCGLQFEGSPVAGNNYVYVTGEIGRLVTIIDVNTGLTLGQGTLLDRNDHACPGFLSIPLTGTLVDGHLLLAESNNTSDKFAQAWVLPGTPTPT